MNNLYYNTKLRCVALKGPIVYNYPTFIFLDDLIVWYYRTDNVIVVQEPSEEEKTELPTD